MSTTSSDINDQSGTNALHDGHNSHQSASTHTSDDLLESTLSCSLNNTSHNATTSASGLAETIKSNEGCNADVDESNEVITEEFECSVCMKLLQDPVSTPCGHTFCKSCIEQNLGYRATCPLCRAPVPFGAHPNYLLSNIISRTFPKTVARRRDEFRTAQLANDEEMRRTRNQWFSHNRVMPLISAHGHLRPPVLPGEEFDMEIRQSSDLALCDHVSHGDRRFGIYWPVDGELNNMGVCVEIIGRRGRSSGALNEIRVAALYRFRLSCDTATTLADGDNGPVAPRDPMGNYEVAAADPFFDDAIEILGPKECDLLTCPSQEPRDATHDVNGCVEDNLNKVSNSDVCTGGNSSSSGSTESGGSSSNGGGASGISSDDNSHSAITDLQKSNDGIVCEGVESYLCKDVGSDHNHGVRRRIRQPHLNNATDFRKIDENVQTSNSSLPSSSGSQAAAVSSTHDKPLSCGGASQMTLDPLAAGEAESGECCGGRSHSDSGGGAASAVQRQSMSEMERVIDLARQIIKYIEEQLQKSGASGQSIFIRKFGNIPSIVDSQASSVEMEKLSFWFCKVISANDCDRSSFFCTKSTATRLERIEELLNYARPTNILSLSLASRRGGCQGESFRFLLLSGSQASAVMFVFFVLLAVWCVWKSQRIRQFGDSGVPEYRQYSHRFYRF